MSPASSTREVLSRLEILWRKLEGGGHYVSANTVFLAIEEIKRLRDELDGPSVKDCFNYAEGYRQGLQDAKEGDVAALIDECDVARFDLAVEKGRRRVAEAKLKDKT